MLQLISLENGCQDTTRICLKEFRVLPLASFTEFRLRDNGSTLQGYSRASWGGNPGGRFEFVTVKSELNHLEVRTTKLAPGYLRRNGIPYSEETGLTEFFDRHNDFNEEWLTVTTIVNDPAYLTQEFITTSSFKKLYDDSDWKPTPCKE